MHSTKRDIVNELHKPARINFDRRHVIIKGLHELWQADLVEMIPYAKENNNFKYLLTVIDCFSKFGFVEALKDKSAESVTKAFKKILDTSKIIPKNLQTDLGKEFYNSKFKILMKNNNINHYSTYTHMKASICERWNRTLKSKMWKMFSVQGSYKWIKHVQEIVKEYNNTQHSTIKMKPKDVTKHDETRLLSTVFNYPKTMTKNKFKINEYVRISKSKGIFSKGYKLNWSTEIFKICFINNKYPVTYIIEDYLGNQIKGRFYEHELQKVKHPDSYLVEKILKRKGNKVFVRWLGFDDLHNTWENKSSLL